MDDSARTTTPDATIEADASATRDDASEPRVHAAWRAWLEALATDAEAAIAAALAYEGLDADGRARWLDALEQDAPSLRAPRVAIYAPLLAVEEDEARRERMREALEQDDAPSVTTVRVRAFRGQAANGERVALVVMPLYLRFVQTVTCRFGADGFVWAEREALVHEDRVPRDAAVRDGVTLEATPVDPVIEDLAHAVVAHRRSGRPMPDAAHVLVGLLAPTYEACG